MTETSRSIFCSKGDSCICVSVSAVDCIVSSASGCADTSCCSGAVLISSCGSSDCFDLSWSFKLLLSPGNESPHFLLRNVAIELIELAFNEVAALTHDWWMHFVTTAVLPMPESPATSVSPELPLATRSNASNNCCTSASRPYSFSGIKKRSLKSRCPSSNAAIAPVSFHLTQLATGILEALLKLPFSHFWQCCQKCCHSHRVREAI